MKIQTRAGGVAEIAADALIVPVFEGESPATPVLASIDAATGGLVAGLVESGELRGKRDSVVYLHAPSGLTARRLVLVGMGAREGDAAAQLDRAVSVGVRSLRGKPHGHIAVADRPELEAELFGEVASRAASMAAIDLAILKTEERDELKVDSVTLACEDGRADGIGRGATRGEIVAAGMRFARELGNAPANDLTPRVFAERVAAMADAEGLAVEVLDETRMQELGMGALLGVAKGSEEPPRLIVVSYEPEGGGSDDDVLTFVGKGLTFDSGGISIKPREGMEWMKYDMCGGAAVAGAMLSVARLRPARRIVGYIGAVENMPSGKAYKPGDVLRSYLGKTIEVLNTDAEGRLVLADVLAYAIERGATRIVDLATLTGACVIALGNVFAAVMGNDQAWTDEVLEASRRGNEKLWQLPMDKAYREQIRSDIADIKNLGGRTAGTITAGYFLREFVGSTPWAHMDIAGTAWVEDDRPDMAKGATGYGVPTLVELADPRG